MTTISVGAHAPAARDRAAAVPGGAGVPWMTVLPLAVLLAFADGFVLTSLRGAVGAIENTDAPFSTWLRQSTLTVPVFALAVIAALGIALHRFGPAPRGRRFAATLLLVVAAGTVAGLVVMVPSAAYDYHLQSTQATMMHAMTNGCGPVCQANEQHATLLLQERAVGVGAVVLVGVNLVLVGWLVALRGGRLDVVARRKGATGSGVRSGARPGARSDDVRVLLAAGLVGSALIHAAVVPEHLAEWAAAGTFFVVLTAAEAGLGALLLARLGPWALRLVAVMSVGTLLLWLWSRTMGLPFGPEPGTPEPLGLADIAACVLEVVTLVAALVMLYDGSRLGSRPAVSAHVRWLAVVALVAVTAIGLGSTELGWLHAFGATGGSMSAAP